MQVFGPDVEKLKTKKDAKGLIIALYDSNGQVRKSAADALKALGDDPLIGLLSDSDERVRRTAALGIGFGNDFAIVALRDLLSDGNDQVRRNAVLGFKTFVDTVSMDTLIDFLSDDNEWVRSRAVFSLGNIGDSAAVKPLIALLSDSDGGVRVNAAFALGKFGGAEVADAVQPLMGLLLDDNSSVRLFAVVALANFTRAGVADAAKVHGALQSVSNDKNETVYKVAGEALEMISGLKPKEEPKPAIFCPSCGTRVQNDDVFCRICGTKLQSA